jgi:hypothetical protein
LRWHELDDARLDLPVAVHEEEKLVWDDENEEVVVMW